MSRELCKFAELNHIKAMLVMKKSVLYLLLFAYALTSCEEKDAPLRFSTESISNSDNVSIEYYSPDPLHCDKSYHITADYEANELTLQCKNANNIYIANKDAESPSFYYSTEGQWSAEMIKPNTVKITFEKIDYEPDPDNISYAGKFDYLSLAADTKKSRLQTAIDIKRFPDFSSAAK